MTPRSASYAHLVLGGFLVDIGLGLWEIMSAVTMKEIVQV